jgi:hypothetical protein
MIKLPEKTYGLGEPLPAIPQKVVSWPWGGTPHLTQWSVEQLKFPLGTIIYDVVDGHPVLAQIQTHYSYGAHPDWPDKAHKGTSVFVPVTTDPSSGKSRAMHDPPEGWADQATMGFDGWLLPAFAMGYLGGFWGARGRAGSVPATVTTATHAGEMYTKRHGGEGYRFSGEVCDSFSVRRYGMIY